MANEANQDEEDHTYTNMLTTSNITTTSSSNRRRRRKTKTGRMCWE